MRNHINVIELMPHYRNFRIYYEEFVWHTSGFGFFFYVFFQHYLFDVEIKKENSTMKVTLLFQYFILFLFFFSFTNRDCISLRANYFQSLNLSKQKERMKKKLLELNIEFHHKKCEKLLIVLSVFHECK